MVDFAVLIGRVGTVTYFHLTVRHVTFELPSSTDAREIGNRPYFFRYATAPMTNRTCQCCGHRTIPLEEDMYWFQCPVCGYSHCWDATQEEPSYVADRDGQYLLHYQWEFREEAEELWSTTNLRPPTQDEPRDPDWRPLYLGHDEERDVIIELVKETFRTVRLGSGTSLDDTYDIDMYREPRPTNRRHVSWQDISEEELFEHGGCGGMSFMDAEGMRFYMPRYLLVELEGLTVVGDNDTSLMFHLSYGPEDPRFALLTKVQRACLVRFIAFMLPYHAESCSEKERAKYGAWFQES